MRTQADTSMIWPITNWILRTRTRTRTHMRIRTLTHMRIYIHMMRTITELADTRMEPQARLPTPTQKTLDLL